MLKHLLITACVEAIVMTVVALTKPEFWTENAIWIVPLAIIILGGIALYDLAKGRKDHEAGQSTTGDQSPSVGTMSGNASINYHSGPEKYRSDDIVTNSPEQLGGSRVLKLGGVATLSLHVPYSSDGVTMRLDEVPISLGSHKGDGFSFANVQITTGTHNEITFDRGENKRHTIEVGGSIFTVSLTEIDASPHPGISKPLRFHFSVAER